MANDMRRITIMEGMVLIMEVNKNMRIILILRLTVLIEKVMI